MKRKIYSEKEFMKLVKKNSSQVFFLVSKVSWPFPFASHPWIVTNEKGKMKRTEVLSHKNEKTKNYIWISKGSFSTPMAMFPEDPELTYRYSKLIGLFEGDEARVIINFMKDIDRKYPGRDRYVYFPGPNSNTFVKWIIRSLGLKLRLPPNAYGKRYVWKIKQRKD